MWGHTRTYDAIPIPHPCPKTRLCFLIPCSNLRPWDPVLLLAAPVSGSCSASPQQLATVVFWEGGPGVGVAEEE